MKGKFLIATTLIITLALSLFPITPASAADNEVWTLTSVQIKPPEGYLEWTQAFGDSNTVKTVTVSTKEFTYRSKTTGSLGTTADLFYKANFDTPPDELVPGESISLKIAGSLTGSAFEVSKSSVTFYLQDWTKDNAVKAILAQTTITLTEFGSPAPQALQFVVPETSDGKLVIKTGNNMASQAEILWIYEPGESKATSPDKTAKPEPAEDTTSTGVGSVSGLQAEKFFTIGWMRATFGEVYIERAGKRIKARKGMPIMTGDIVTTLDKGLASIELDDKDPTREGVGPSLINLPSKSEMGMESFRVFVDEAHGEPSREGVFEIFQAKIRVFTKGWGANSSFSVKAGVSICGIRGSDVFISYDPDTEKAEAYVIEGHMDVTNQETGDMKSLTDNQKLVVENGKIGEIQPLSQAEWDTLVKENGVEKMEPLSQDELDRLLAEKDEGSSGSPTMPIIIGVGAVVVAGLAFFGLRRRAKS